MAEYEMTYNYLASLADFVTKVTLELTIVFTLPALSNNLWYDF